MANELILAVDDEAHILELLSFNLEASGYRVVTAATGEDALTVCQQERPAMVLLDIMLPGMDGMEVCRRLKARLRRPIFRLLCSPPREKKWTRFWAWSSARTIILPSRSLCAN